MRRGDASAHDLGTFPQTFGEKYVLVDHLATGGMSEVYLAQQTGAAGFVKPCVIKRLLPHLARDAQFRAMFLDEARLQARLNHPYIAQVFDLGELDNSFFIAMEFVDGVDLEQVITGASEKGEHLPYDIAARIVSSIADGLDHAHNAVDEHDRPLKLVHRDVTPSNIMVTYDGVPKLLDFGIAKAAERQAQTEVGVVKGKSRYMSPEQAQGRPLDGRSDLFSLGTILFEMTTGRNPWNADAPALVTMRIIGEEPTPPSLLVLDYPDELEAIVRHALAKTVSQRVATGHAMHQELEQFMQRLGLHATPRDVAAYLIQRFPRAAPRRAIAALPPVKDEKTEVTEMPTRQAGPTGPLSLGDGQPMIGEMGGEREFPPQRDRRSGGSGFIAVIVGLVVAVAVALYVLHGYEMKKESHGGAVASPTGGSESSPTPPAPAVTPPVAAVAVKPDPSAPADTKPVAVAKPAIPDAPKVTPIDTSDDTKPDPKKPAHHASSPHKDSGHPAAHSVELPHLPKPPPTEE